MKITLLGGTAAVAEAKVKISPTGTMTVPLKFSKAFELLERGQANGDNFTLQVTSFYTMTSGKVHLQEGSIHCTQVRLNTVTSIALSLMRDSTSSKWKKRKGDKEQEGDDANVSDIDEAKEGEGTLHIYQTRLCYRHTLPNFPSSLYKVVYDSSDRVIVFYHILFCCNPRYFRASSIRFFITSPNQTTVKLLTSLLPN